MVPTWFTIYLTNYVINQWPTAFGPISNPSVFEVLYLLKYFGGFGYFISHDIKNWFKNAVTLHWSSPLTAPKRNLKRKSHRTIQMRLNQEIMSSCESNHKIWSKTECVGKGTILQVKNCLKFDVLILQHQAVFTSRKLPRVVL